MNLHISFKKVTKLFKKHSQQAGSHDAYHDWGRLLAGFFAALLVAIGIAGFVYFKVDRGGFAEVASPASEGPTLNRTSFQAVVDRYDAKEKRLGELKQQPVTVVDPAR